ncbi:MAG: hypothetical protein RLZZ61_1509 [Pseudomonadota bacterium]|jgi:glycine dehydrogenase subunit 2
MTLYVSEDHDPRRHLDETQAARKPVLVWREPEQAVAAV